MSASREQDGPGARKGRLYAGATRRVERALRAGFWVEAIALEEAMISDRLAVVVTANRLSDRIQLCRSLATGPPDVALLDELDAWRRLRNRAIHGMVTAPPGEETEWRARLSEARTCARAGYPLFRRVDAWVRRVRQSQRRRAVG